MRLSMLKIFVFALIVFTAGSALASFSDEFSVTVNTSSLTSNSPSGYLYFQFFRDPNDNLANATAQILNFATNGTLGAQDTTDVVNGSAVSGTLPSTVTFKNTNQINDYDQAIAFGQQITFDVLLTLTQPDPYYTDTLSMWLFQDGAGTVPLQTASGELFEIDLNGNGTVTTSVMDPNTNVVPEPGTALLLCSGLLGLAGLKFRRNKAA